MNRQSDAGRARPEDVIDGLVVLFNEMREHFERVIQPFDIPGPCAKALRLIDGAISMKELGARIQCDASFITAIADSLEERGLARREVDPDDRRIKKLVLTERGAEVRDRLVERLTHDVPCLRNLDADERDSFLALLRKMVGAGDAEPAVPAH